MTPLFEQYRPREWSAVVGQDKALAKIQTLAKRGLAGRGWLISGMSGTGKSSIGRILASEVAAPDEAYVKLLYACGNNMRRAWQEIEAGAMLK